MDLEQLDIQEAEQLENMFESSALSFNKLKHTYFKNYIRRNETYLDFLKVGFRHFSFQFPENFDEIFLKKMHYYYQNETRANTRERLCSKIS